MLDSDYRQIAPTSAQPTDYPRFRTDRRLATMRVWANPRRQSDDARDARASPRVRLRGLGRDAPLGACSTCAMVATSPPPSFRGYDLGKTEERDNAD
ncbi:MULTISPECIES: hypothetical protein [unclassified Variovorax]|jgi:hypothetical protein|uniref:hypothetical protein n=1 Tax=unclassified Variovorax TaxID=663243 RepID=UPI000F7E0590|nr:MULTISPECIES: hypothetical protein [unclassified Variovorax]RSZ38225.1 hypothetical protein EJO70_18975 [Variovorax sp. 553]RSZ39324.1 hypothetical protein EJO71_20275 [Variovorax sp. 679]